MSTDLAPQWRPTSIPPIPPEKFGKDHWSTFAYVETRCVDYKGTLNHNHMRCDERRHPIMMSAKPGMRATMALGTRYPTLLAAGQQQPDHDDYDCLDDLIAAGLLEVHMPELAEGHFVEHYYVDAYGGPVLIDGEVIDPGFVTGMTELWLCTAATFSLTERGARVAAALCRHKAAGGNFAGFRMEEPADDR